MAGYPSSEGTGFGGGVGWLGWGGGWGGEGVGEGEGGGWGVRGGWGGGGGVAQHSLAIAIAIAMGLGLGLAVYISCYFVSYIVLFVLYNYEYISDLLITGHCLYWTSAELYTNIGQQFQSPILLCKHCRVCSKYLFNSQDQEVVACPVQYDCVVLKLAGCGHVCIITSLLVISH